MNGTLWIKNVFFFFLSLSLSLSQIRRLAEAHRVRTDRINARISSLWHCQPVARLTSTSWTGLLGLMGLMGLLSLLVWWVWWVGRVGQVCSCTRLLPFFVNKLSLCIICSPWFFLIRCAYFLLVPPPEMYPPPTTITTTLKCVHKLSICMCFLGFFMISCGFLCAQVNVLDGQPLPTAAQLGEKKL